jgi:hypothetical protein
MGGACSTQGEMIPWRRWEDNIRMSLMEIGREGVDFIHLA